MNKNAMFPHNISRYYYIGHKLLLPGLKIKNGIQDGRQNKISWQI